MSNRLQLTQLAASIALVAGSAAFVSSAHAAAPTAGTNISNIASASYTDSNGASKTVTSNEVKTTVLQVSSFTLVDDRTATANPNGQVSLSHTLTNTGNGSDSYRLTITQLTTDDFNLNNIRIYIDRNKDGVPDDNNDLVGQTVSLAPNESVGLIVVSTVPSTQTNGSAQYTLTATSQFDTTDIETDTDTVSVVTGAVMQIQKAASVSTVSDNGEITYTLTYKNTGNSAADNVVIEDTLDLSKVDYVGGSGLWSGSATALDDATGANDPSGINYSINPTTGKITVVLANVTQNTTGTVKFKVKAKATNTANILNSATIFDGEDLDNDPNTTPTIPTGVTPTPSNETIVERTKSYTGVINERTGSDASAGDTYADAAKDINDVTKDNLVKESTTQGTPVVFGNGANSADAGPDRIVVHNTGNITEVYNVTIDKTDLPANSIVELFKSDGVTPLTDTNNDGILDTGPIAPGATYQVIAKVTLPSNYSTPVDSATTDDVILTISPVDNASATDTFKLSIVDVTPATVDLFNGDSTDTTAGGPISGSSGKDTGAPVDTITVEPGQAATFPLAVTNSGSNVDNFNLSNTTLPTGWTVQYYLDTNNDGQPDGAPVTNTGSIPANGTVHLVAVVTPPANQPAGNQDIVFTVVSPATGLSDKMSDRVIVDENRILSLVSDNTGQVAPGGTITYTHTLTNNGNITEGDADNELPFTLVNSQAANGWVTNLYVDLNGDGIADANELVTGNDIAAKLKSYNPDNDSTLGLEQGQSVRLIVKVEAPANATAGTQSSAVLTISPTVIGGDSVTPLANTDLTTVNDGQVRLVKEQALDAACDGDADTTYTQNTISAKPGQCVKYRITATNEGNVNVTNVVVSDTTPAYTTYQVIASKSPVVTNATLGSTPTNGGTGSISANKTPLAPNTNAILEFVIKVDN